MKFVAHRLSDGNKLFPAEIHIDDEGVTVRIPGLFSGKSKYIDFSNITSVDVDSPLIGYSTITLYTGGRRISAHGFTSNEVEQIKEAINSGKRGRSTGYSDETILRYLEDTEEEEDDSDSSESDDDRPIRLTSRKRRHEEDDDLDNDSLFRS